MILTCPNCAARFMIDGAALGPTGRTVRCGACGHSWLQLPEPAGSEAEPFDTPESEHAPQPAMRDAAAAARAADAAAGAAAEEIEGAPHKRRFRFGARKEEADAGAGELPRPEGAVSAAAVLEEFQGEEPRRRGLSRVLVWFIFVFILAALAMGAFKFRQDIVTIWPPATRLYQLVGLSVDPPSGYGLRVPQDSIKFRREAEGGTPILVVSGEILNESKAAQRVTPMRIMLLDKENRVLRTERVKIDDRMLDPGKKLPFQTSIPNYPAEAVSVRIVFDLTSG